MPLTPATIDQIQKALWSDMDAFAPELALCGAIVLLLILRLFSVLNRVHLGWVALLTSLGALALALNQLSSGPVGQRELFSTLLVYDDLTIFMRCFLLLFAALVVLLSMLTGIPDREDSSDFYCLLLGATL